ncbi:MAG: hypothetical protein KDC71_20240 [Acidobacteria bacterium]|nr:hypothetical protein [Acidobacteriota bacterium]
MLSKWLKRGNKTPEKDESLTGHPQVDFAPTPCAPRGVVIKGGELGDLEQKAISFTFPLGATGILGTDPGMGKSPNEDAAVVVPSQNFAAAIDGVGGYWGGDKAAEFLGLGLLTHQSEYALAIERAKKEMTDLQFEEALRLYGSSACFVGVKLFPVAGGRFISIGMCGDCRLILLRKDGTILQTEDESYIMDLIKANSISSDEALYSDFRNRITNAVRLAFNTEVTINPHLIKNGELDAQPCPVEVQTGDRLLLMSDGISDNLTALEIQSLVRDKTLHEAFQILAQTSLKRMQQMEHLIDEIIRQYLSHDENIEKPGLMNRLIDKIGGHQGPYTWLYQTIFHKARAKYKSFSDGYKSKPSRDNRSLIIIDITEPN